MNKAAEKLGTDMVKNIEKAQKESNDLVKQLNSELHELAELINQVLDSQNDLIKAVVTNYEAISEIAKKNNVLLPIPKTNMTLD